MKNRNRIFLLGIFLIMGAYFLCLLFQTGNTKYLTKVNKKVVKETKKVIKQQIKPDMTQVEKVKAIHDYLVLHTAYDYKNYQKNTIPSSSYSPEGVLLYGSGVCQGYAETFLLFMEVLEIPCQIIIGKGNGEAHAWNIVKIEGKWYQIDVTWDDPVPDIPERIGYDYFLIPDKIMRENHTWNSSDYPACTSWDYVYYTDQEYIVDSIDQFKAKFLEQF